MFDRSAISPSTPTLKFQPDFNWWRRGGRRRRRKDTWTKAFKKTWQPLEDWKLPRKIKDVRSGDTDFFAILTLVPGSRRVTSRLHEAVALDGCVERGYKSRPGWDIQAYGGSLHDVFPGSRTMAVTRNDGGMVLLYEEEFLTVHPYKYPNKLSEEERHLAVEELLARRFQPGWVKAKPLGVPSDAKGERPKESGSEQMMKREPKCRQSGESHRTYRNKIGRLEELSRPRIVGNGGPYG